MMIPAPLYGAHSYSVMAYPYPRAGGGGGGRESATGRPMRFDSRTWCYAPSGLGADAAHARSLNSVQGALREARESILGGGGGDLGAAFTSGLTGSGAETRYSGSSAAAPVPPRMPCPIPEMGDFIGNSTTPGSRSQISNPSPESFPVLGGQQICLGDIVTLRDGHVCQVGSVAASGDGMNWGDVGNRAYMALAGADTASLPNGGDTVALYGPGSRVETFLDEGITAGMIVGVDLRALGKDGARVDRDSAVAPPLLRPADRSLWQRSRLLSDAGSDIAKRATLGLVTKVISRRAPQSYISMLGDVGIVQLGC